MQFQKTCFLSHLHPWFPSLRQVSKSGRLSIQGWVGTCVRLFQQTNKSKGIVAHWKLTNVYQWGFPVCVWRSGLTLKEGLKGASILCVCVHVVFLWTHHLLQSSGSSCQVRRKLGGMREAALLGFYFQLNLYFFIFLRNPVGEEREKAKCTCSRYV